MSVKQIGIQVCFLILLLSFTGWHAAYAQHTVSGTVTDGQSGETLPGVNILVKGTATGTSTESKGHYRLEVASLQDTLVFSFIGYQTRRMPIDGRTEIDVAMQTHAISGQELVVVGYGTQKKSDLTGSVTSIDSKEINNQSASDPASALQGKLPGLKVFQSSGEPGNTGTSLQIRGQGTFSSAGNDPLVIIDGIPGDLSSVNPQDIDEVTVLKDAAAASIYGTRAANGVILITTKNGSSQGMQLEYDYNVGVYQPTKMLDLVTNSAEYMRLYNQALSHNGSPAAFTDDQINQYVNATDRHKYPNTDWLNIMFNPAYVQNHYLSLSGGTDSTTYRVSLGYLDEPGTMKGFNYDKYTLQFNLNSDINDRIRFGSNLNLKYGNRLAPRQGAADLFLSTTTQAPMYGPKLYDGSGRYTYDAFNAVYHNKNPIAIAEKVQAREKTYRAQGSIFLNIDFLKHLTGEIRGGINFNYYKKNDFRPEIPLYGWLDSNYRTDLDVGQAGLQENRNNSINPTVNAKLTYDNNWQDHSLKALVGIEQESYNYNNISGFRKDFPNNILQELNAGGAGGQTVNGTSYSWALRSIFGRVNYSYKNRYLLQANFRYDGSSRFPKENRWAAFPSFSAGWRISEEPFLDDANWLNELKIRASWGKLGNQDIGNYPYQTVYNIGYNYPFDYSSIITGVRPSGLVDKNIKWETTKMIDVGMDWSILQDKVSFTIDWYKKGTYDILRTGQIPIDVGLTPPTVNNGQLNNTGFEFSADYQNNIGAFRYSIGGNFQAVKNKLVNFGAPQINDHTIYQEGKAYNTFYMYDWIGIFQSEEDVANSPNQPFNPKPGDLKFKDTNGDGEITPDDKVYVGGQFPDYTYGLNLSASYKQFDFGASFYGVQGTKRYVKRWGIEPFFQSAAPTTDWKNAWTPENKTNDMPALYKAGFGSYPAIESLPSTYFLRNTSYFRLRNLTIGYSLSENILRSLGTIKGLRIYFRGQNLLTVTNYSYLDPESTGRFVSYPQNKVYSLGAQIKF